MRARAAVLGLALAWLVRRVRAQLLQSSFDNGWDEFTAYTFDGSSDCSKEDYMYDDDKEDDTYDDDDECCCATFERGSSALRGICCAAEIPSSTPTIGPPSMNPTSPSCWDDVGCDELYSWACDALCYSGPQNGDHTSSSGHYIYAPSASFPSDAYSQYLESPPFVGGDTGVVVQFSYTMWSKWFFMGNLSLETFDGEDWSRQWRKAGFQSADWLDASVPATGNISKIRFVASVQSTYSDIAIDDVSVFVAPTPSPTSMPS